MFSNLNSLVNLDFGGFMKMFLGLFGMMVAVSSAQAKAINLVCTPNSSATVSQFAAQATLEVDDNNNTSGTFNYSLKVSKSQQATAIESVKVEGKMLVL